MAELPKNYEPNEIEPRWYAEWMARGYFHADAAAPKAPFAIVIPPPNVTGLAAHGARARRHDRGHLHALAAHGRLQRHVAAGHRPRRHRDADGGRARAAREREARAATTSAARRSSSASGTGAQRTGDRILEQLKLLGCSLDWDRPIFTMDPPYSAAVIEAFVRLYEEGLIYRARRLINWCASCRTALSDLEVDYDEGDAGRAVRVRLSAGRRLGRGGGRDDAARDDAGRHGGRRAPGRSAPPGEDRQDGRPPVRRTASSRSSPTRCWSIPKFGTGAVKVTPAHDPNDFETRPAPQPADDLDLRRDGRRSTPRGARSRAWTASRRARRSRRGSTELGLERGSQAARARGRPLPALRDGRRADAVDPVVREDGAAGQAGHRGGGAGQDQVRPRELVEDLLPLDAQHPRLVHLAAAVVGPPHPGLVLRHVQRDRRWRATTPDRLRTVRRHRAHAGRGRARHLVLVVAVAVRDARLARTRRASCKTFYPTTVLDTGYDILFFWVARMMMAGLHFMKKVPFRTVYLHTMVTDEKGEKMSKVKGNTIDPLDVIDKHGADALRFALAWLTTQRRAGQEHQVLGRQRRGRAPLRQQDLERDALRADEPRGLRRRSLRRPHRRRARPRRARSARALDPLARAARRRGGRHARSRSTASPTPRRRPTTSSGTSCATGTSSSPRRASRRCRRREADREARRKIQGTLVTALETAMRLLHPFMPFLTEEIWQQLPKPSGAPAEHHDHALPGARRALPRRRLRGVDGAGAEDHRRRAQHPRRARTSRRATRAQGAAGRRRRLQEDDPRGLQGDHRRAGASASEVRVRRSGASLSGEFVLGQTAMAMAGDVEVMVPLEGIVDPAAEKAKLREEPRQAGQGPRLPGEEARRPELRQRAPRRGAREGSRAAGRARGRHREARARARPSRS